VQQAARSEDRPRPTHGKKNMAEALSTSILGLGGVTVRHGTKGCVDDVGESVTSCRGRTTSDCVGEAMRSNSFHVIMLDDVDRTDKFFPNHPNPYESIRRRLLIVNVPVDVMSTDTCDEDRKKCDDVRSILRMNTMSLDWFKPSRGIIALHPFFYCIML
jgi:hypothetical protein